jgi:uncharacterized protein YlxP (DUF503 family)
MGFKKFFAKAESFLDDDKRKCKEKRKCLKHVLKKLRKYEKELQASLADESDKKAVEKLNKKIALVRAKRKKALALLKEHQ